MNQLGLFAKFWLPGRVKTRLAAEIGELAACNLYRQFVFHLLENLSSSADDRFVVFSPPEQEPAFRDSIPHHWKLQSQSNGDLGERMQTFFQTQFQQAATERPSKLNRETKVVVIGADCPHLKPADIELAFDALDKAPVVLGPSPDGGYYLVGMKNHCVDIFSDIQWSTATVFEATVARLKHFNIEPQILPPLTDVDDLQGLLALQKTLTTRLATLPSDPQESSFTSNQLEDTLLHDILTTLALQAKPE
ncbi:MAG: rSAM/selenodomain-associated transferase 1 [Mariniblastus sp.]